MDAAFWVGNSVQHLLSPFLTPSAVARQLDPWDTSDENREQIPFPKTGTETAKLETFESGPRLGSDVTVHVGQSGPSPSNSPTPPPTPRMAEARPGPGEITVTGKRSASGLETTIGDIMQNSSLLDLLKTQLKTSKPEQRTGLVKGVLHDVQRASVVAEEFRAWKGRQVTSDRAAFAQIPLSKVEKGTLLPIYGALGLHLTSVSCLHHHRRQPSAQILPTKSHRSPQPVSFAQLDRQVPEELETPERIYSFSLMYAFSDRECRASHSVGPTSHFSWAPTFSNPFNPVSPTTKADCRS